METLKAESPMNLNVAFNLHFLPDSIPNDSLEEQMYQFGDTISVLIDGYDTVYTIYNDTASNFWIVDPFSIYVTPSGNAKVVNPDMFGVNVSSMFQHAPESENIKYENTQDPWALLTELKPRVLRFPDGSGGKFSRLLGSQNLDPDSDDYLKWNGGYGFNLDEIIAYYDFTDGIMSVPEKEVDDIVSEYIADPLTIDLSWINDQDKEDFKTLIGQYINQAIYDPSLIEYDSYEEQPLFINEFINLVKQIEEQDPENEDDDYRVDVILCIDIINETAERNLEIIDYLVNQHGINVVGIELGNEVYSKFHGRSMGFKNSGLGGTPKSAFSFYWDYIHGLDYSSYFDLSQVLPPAMQVTNAHNYIGILNDASGFDNIGYGIPAENLHSTGAPFKTIEDFNVTGGGGGLPEWNEDLYNHYENDDDENESLDFDAVILHPYYTPQSNGVGANENWREIPLCLDPVGATVGIYEDYSELWNFATYDEDLRCAFDDIIGIGAITGNFRDLTRTRHKQNYLGHNSTLHFDEFEAKGKQLWTTESNLLDVEKGALDDLQMRLSVFTNSFAHAYLLQEWHLKNIKMNYYPEFINPNFYTVSTWQNFVGGSTIDFLYASDKQDQIELGVLPNEVGDDTGCDENKIDEYFVPRTTYHTLKLLSEISSNSLDYLPNSASLVFGNLNLAPSVFIDQDRENIYVYYTNINSTQQKYVINPENLLSFYPYADAVRLDLLPIEIFAIDAEQLYSNSGRSALFSMSEAYDLCQEEGVYNNRYEILDITASSTTSSCAGSAPPGAACVVVPGYSAGFFKIQLSPFILKLGEMENVFTLYPNPTATSFTFISNAFLEIQTSYKLSILDLAGKLVFSQQVIEGQNIDVSKLPVGMYTVLIYNGYNNIEVEKLIKMQ